MPAPSPAGDRRGLRARARIAAPGLLSAAVLFAMFAVAGTTPRAQTGPDDESTPSMSEPVRMPLAPHTTGPGEILYSQLVDSAAPGRETRASVDAVVAWTQSSHGASVLSAARRHAEAAGLAARARHAEYEAGLAGFADRGAK